MSEDKDLSALAATRLWRREWRTKSASARSMSIGLLQFVLCLGLYCVLFYFAFAAPTMLLRVMSGMLLPSALGALFLVGHDASHQSLTPVRWVNSLLGRIACLPSYHPYTSWTHAHCSLHHAWTCFKGKHPDFAPMSKAEYDALPAWRRLVERLYRSPIGPPFSIIFSFWLPFVLWPTGDRRPSRIWQLRADQFLVAAFMIGQLLIAYKLAERIPGALLSPLPMALWVVLGSWFIWISAMGWVSYFQHTHPKIAWYDEASEWQYYHAQLRGSAHVQLPWSLDRLLSNIMDHPAHHLDALIPMHALPESQALLEDIAPHHSMLISAKPSDLLKTFAACKLYDFRRHCWMDFEGTPTSMLSLHQPQSS